MFSKFFIDRPIFATVLALLIVVAGLVTLGILPIAQYPDITPPTVQVSAVYPGANAQTVAQTVGIPIEQQVNGVDGMLYMSSNSSSSGAYSLTITFAVGTDIDMATVQVQNRVSVAQSSLPTPVVVQGVTVQKQSSNIVMFLTMTSDSKDYDGLYLSNYAKLNLVDQLTRVPGVGAVNVMGAGDYSMRIWLDPAAMRIRYLSPADVYQAIQSQNVEVSAGNVGQPIGTDNKNAYQYSLTVKGRLTSPEEFGNIILRTETGGKILRLRDVAHIDLGSASYSVVSQLDGKPTAAIAIYQQPGSNSLDVSKGVKAKMQELSQNFPAGIQYNVTLDTTDVIHASIDEVMVTFLETTLLVVLVIFLFLQNWRAVVIPCITIPVSLIGTLAVMSLFGFSINTLTLFGLILAVAIVVDDAIVVVEAVQAKFDEGYRSPYKATVAAMDGISAAIVTTSLVFMAVFIPTSFMGGTSGVFYTQFGLTMAVAVGISAINALTLSPALCALIMTPHMDKSTGGKLSFSSRFHHAFEASFNRLVLKYKNGVSFFLRRKWMAWVSLAAVCALLVFFMRTTKTGLVPDEDMGTIFVNVTTPPGSSLAQTRKTMEMIDERIREIPQIKIYSNVTGYSMMGGQAASGGMLIIKLKHWDERQEAQDHINAIIAAIYQHTADIKSAKLFAFAQPTIMGYGMGSGFEMYVQDRAGGSVENLQKYTQDFIAALNRRPEISMAYTTFDTKFPQYMVEVDAVKCQRARVTTSDVLSVLSGYIGGNYSSNLNRFSKLYRVMIQARKDYRLDKESLNNMFVRTESGEMAPVGQFITLTKVYGAETLTRFNMYTSIPVNGMPADGYSSGDAIAAIEEVASQTLPTGYGYEFSGITREESSSTGNTVIIFIICIVFIYLILCSLYESIFIPMVVILAVPFGLMGSFLFAKCLGLENNIYMQTGLIMLIGLLSKTAILLTEYASARRRQGMSIAQAAVAAAGVRLRPILMTALTMIIGLFPLIVATGAGANGNRSLGVGTVGGMLVGTVALLFVVPVLFTVFQAIEERVMPRRQTDAAE